ncbi:MAG: hypothetical protein RMJ00_02465 [Nitrososphaerota archaeon]|nr:hypothetical protein [Candidatus Bathyarchaeota archaeon]MCX8162901.1 hypothetical protein [Candidatus Bathyarchaeota archaeon]MDW8061544.1 hypothetical protein [Nitrososphaerota archaeon]
MFRWSAKRFKYGDLGFTPRIAVQRAYPSASFEKLLEIFSEKLQIPFELSELLIFSSLPYLSPTIFDR